MSNENDLRVYFIRHKLGKEENKALRDNKLIAWDFGGGCHDNLEDYEEYKKNKNKSLTRAHNAFKELETNGGVVVAEYDDRPYEFIVAKIKKPSKRMPFSLDGSNYIYTSLKFEDGKPFNYNPS